jgi:uracil-DNA glycosylase
LNPQDTPSSNICFVRSKREKNLTKQIKGYIDLCWDFHENVIKKLNIKIILCFGKTSGNEVKKRLNANEKVDEFIENNKRKWKTQVYKNTIGQYIIIAPHPSVVNWKNKKTDPSQLVEKYLDLIK